MRLQVRYHGRVQGVGFRATARAVAAEFAVVGFVRNEPDGTVLLEAQGEEGEVEAFLAQLAQTMSRHITRADKVVLPPREDENRFEVTRI